MCIITSSFIFNIKYYLGSLGFSKKMTKDFSLLNVQKYVQEKLLSLKEIGDAFYVNYHYEWIKKHHKKIVKAIKHEKWKNDKARFAQRRIEFLDKPKTDVMYATNMFYKTINFYRLDDGGKIEQVQIDKFNICDKVIAIEDHDIKNHNHVLYIYTKEYLSTIKSKNKADKDKAIAVVNIKFLDLKMEKIKYIAYITNIKEKDKINSIMYAVKLQIEKMIRIRTTGIISGLKIRLLYYMLHIRKTY